MNFKKVIALVLVVVMAMALFAGCGSTPAEEPAPAEAAEPAAKEPTTGSLEGKRVRVVIGSTSTGGDSYTMSEIVTRYLGEEMGFNGNADIIYGDYSSFVEFTKEGVDPQLAMKMFDFAGKMEAGFATMADNGITFNGEPFVFNKDFAMYFPKDMDEAVLAEIVAAMQKVDANPDFQAEMAKLKYNPVTPEESDLQASRDFINAKNENAKALVEMCPSLDELT